MCLVELLLIKTFFSACNFISEGRSSYPLSGDMIIFSVG